MGSDPEELAATLRELGCLDPVELGLEVVLERIVQAAAAGCGSTGGRRLAAARPRRQAPLRPRGGPAPTLSGRHPGPARRRPLGGRVLAGRAGLQQRPCRRAALARLSPAGAGGGHPGVAERAGAPAPRPHRRVRRRPHRPAGVAAPRPGGRRRLRAAAGGDPAAGHRTAAGAAVPGAAGRGPARHPDRAGAWRHHAARTARPGRCGRNRRWTSTPSTTQLLPHAIRLPPLAAGS